MKNIIVEDQNYKFEEIPGKGMCLVPVVKTLAFFHKQNVHMGIWVQSLLHKDKYVLAYTSTISDTPMYSLINLQYGSYPDIMGLNQPLENIINFLNRNQFVFINKDTL